jgi:hypothetical protein
MLDYRLKTALVINNYELGIMNQGLRIDFISKLKHMILILLTTKYLLRRQAYYVGKPTT